MSIRTHLDRIKARIRNIGSKTSRFTTSTKRTCYPKVPNPKRNNFTGKSRKGEKTINGSAKIDRPTSTNNLINILFVDFVDTAQSSTAHIQKDIIPTNDPTSLLHIFSIKEKPEFSLCYIFFSSFCRIVLK